MPHPDLDTALIMLDCCRFAYKAYAQSCVYPMDPFYESHGEGTWQGARDRVMAFIHKTLGTSALASKFDPIQYKLDVAPHPMQGVVYRGGTGTKPYIYFPPHTVDKAIAVAMGVDIGGADVTPATITQSAGSYRCCHFQGMTGMTKADHRSGWRSWLGAAILSAPSNRLVIVFRGSRSGKASRAAGQALFSEKGSPDWVTDMDYRNEVRVERFENAKFSAGFWLAYASCKRSLECAVAKVLQGRPPPEQILFTGHSLGGALAQCAYVDMFAHGGLFAKTPLEGLKDSAEVYCYPISAPPIVLGKTKSPAKVRKIGREENIFHYFLPKDAVHESKETETTGASAFNSFLGFVSHPLTSTAHLGKQFLLPSGVGFPDAHEPTEVRKALCKAISNEKHRGDLADPDFWPTFTFNVHEPELPVSTLGLGLKLAFLNSIPYEVVWDQASLWSEIQRLSHKTKSGSAFAPSDGSEWKEHKGDGKDVDYVSLEAGEGEHFAALEDAEKCIIPLHNPFADDKDRTAALAGLKAARATLLKIYSSKGGAKKHKATSAVAWMMLQYIAAMYYARFVD